jgi:ATP-dependent Lon protease
MTGEITLTGLVLPIGGIRESRRARRHGIKTVILPARNMPDLAELPAEVRNEMNCSGGNACRRSARRAPAARAAT